MEIHKLCVFYENFKNCLGLAAKWKYLKQIFENLNYLNKNIVSVYFTRAKAEKIDKNEMPVNLVLGISDISYSKSGFRL
jgi:hypothetical protein